MADAAYYPWITRLRAFIIDYVDKNLLLNDEENSDDSMQFAIEDSLEYVGNAFQPTVSYNVSNIRVDVPWYLVRDGAVINILKANMINSARNQHSYSDNGGTQERDQDTYGRYISIVNIMESQWKEEVRKFKAALNIALAYGGVNSEFAINYENNQGLR